MVYFSSMLISPCFTLKFATDGYSNLNELYMYIQTYRLALKMIKVNHVLEVNKSSW